MDLRNNSEIKKTFFGAEIRSHRFFKKAVRKLLSDVFFLESMRNFVVRFFRKLNVTIISVIDRGLNFT